MHLNRFVCFALLCGVALAQDLSTRPAAVTPQGPPKLPNSNPVYQALRNVTVGQEAFSVNGLVLQRESTRFTFTSGTLCMLAPVNGKVTGAVFVGKGSFNLVPPPQATTEVRQIALLTKEGKVDEEFDKLVLRFTDKTYEEVKKAPGATPASGATCPADALDDFNKRFRKDLYSNISGRILQDVLSDEPGGLFVALIDGKKYSSRMLFQLDPHPFGSFVPEEVSLMTFNDNKWGIWASYHMASCYASNQGGSAERNSFWYPERHSIDTTIEKNAKLTGKSTTYIVSNVEGLRVVPMNLFSTLRATEVISDKGEQLDFIQEKKDEDSDYFVILPKALHLGEKYTFTSSYSGKEAVTNEGDGNYYPVTRSAWYPNHDFGTYTTYDLTFRIPKNMKMVATGDLVREITEGNQNISEWKSEAPIAVAGFNFGKFKTLEATLERGGYKVKALANESKSDSLAALDTIQNMSEGALGAIGTLDTTATLKRALSEAQASVFLYHDYFGPMSYKSVAVTQQSAWGYGQAWPGLVYLPVDYFLDATARHELLGFDPHGYYKVVAPHEVAHQWWGHTVGFNSYRDQWMSEGFADFSASLFLQLIRKDMGEYRKFWKDQRQSIIQKNAYGIRAIDVGPLTMGRRLSTAKTSNVYTDLIYPKGSYVLHMLRWMMWDNNTGDQRFKAMMQDFVNTYRNQPATTEDFKATVEKHMLPGMNLDGNRKMDWFFNEWVYGTALPKYAIEHSFTTGPDGGTQLKFKVTQSNVDSNFKMIVPLYLELGDGRIIRLGSGGIIGNNSMESTVSLGKMQSPPKRALVNYYYDILSDD